MSSTDHSSQLVEAIRSGDNDRIESEWGKLQPVLYNFLIGRMNASPEDAEDCIQKSLLTVIEKVNDDSISNPDQIKSYLIRCCKHNYFRVIERRQKETASDELPDIISTAEQLDNLVEQQNKILMEKCLETLPDENKIFISQIYYSHQNNLTELAKEYNISPNAAWTRKHRIIQKLIDCVKKIENSV